MKVEAKEVKITMTKDELYRLRDILYAIVNDDDAREDDKDFAETLLQDILQSCI